MNIWQLQYIMMQMAWFLVIVAAYFAWPAVRHRRSYSVAGATLLFSPLFAGFYGLWPVVFGLPFSLTRISDPKGIFPFLLLSLGFGALTAALAWMAYSRFGAATTPSDNFRDSGIRAYFGRFGEKRFGWLRVIVDLALLFVLVQGYLGVWDLGLRIYVVW